MCAKIATDHGAAPAAAPGPSCSRCSAPLRGIAAKKGELAERRAAPTPRDAAQRFALTLDVLRERGNNDIAHEAAGTPPVLIYDYEVVLDGKTCRGRPTRCCSRSCRPPASR